MRRGSQGEVPGRTGGVRRALVCAALWSFQESVGAIDACVPEIVEIGTCEIPVASLEECSQTVLLLAEIPDTDAPAIAQVADDRPWGCWWQEGDAYWGDPNLLFFNVPPENAAPVSCEGRKCICCLPPPVEGESPPEEEPVEDLVPVGDCAPEFVTVGTPYGEGCLHSLPSREACGEAVNLVEDAVAQSAPDRPAGCWWQPGTQNNAGVLYYNEPPGDSGGAVCSEDFVCICCIETTTTTTTTTTTRSCVPLLMTAGPAGEGICDRPLNDEEECTKVANMLPDVEGLVAAAQSAEDRPKGCWLQGTSALFYNTPFFGLSIEECSESRTCVCCGDTTTTTTYSGICAPMRVNTRAPFDITCPQPLRTPEECFSVATDFFGEGIAQPGLQDEPSRPYGCWYQKANAFNGPLLFWNNAFDAESPEPCSEDRPCLCCGVDGQATTTTTTPYCLLGFKDQGLPGEGCLREILHEEECARMASQSEEIGPDVELARQSEADRPPGCWWLPGSAGQSPQLWYNSAESAESCTPERQCLCCVASTTTTTTATITTLTITTSTTSTTTATTTTATFTTLTTTTTTATTTTSTTTTTIPNPMLQVGAPVNTAASAMLLFVVMGGVMGAALVAAVGHQARVHFRKQRERDMALADAEDSGSSGPSPSPAPGEPGPPPVLSKAVPLSPRSLARLFSGAVSPAGVPQRSLLINNAFTLLDVSNTGFLSCNEMQRFAEFMGFRGTGPDWKYEWLDMCKYLGCDPVLGMDFTTFTKLLNDRSPQGCFSSNADLRLLRDLGPQLQQASAGGVAPPVPHALGQAVSQAFQSSRPICGRTCLLPSCDGTAAPSPSASASSSPVRRVAPVAAGAVLARSAGAEAGGDPPRGAATSRAGSRASWRDRGAGVGIDFDTHLYL